MLFLQDIDLSLAFYDQPKRLWKRLASNNVIERFHREIRRRVRLIDSFRDEHSCERIIYTQVAEFNRKQELSP
jgi:transposase-like protein